MAIRLNTENASNQFRCGFIQNEGEPMRVFCNAPNCDGRIVNGEVICQAKRDSDAMMRLSEPD